MHDAINCLTENGFVISREPAGFDILVDRHERVDVEIITIHSVENEILVMLRKRKSSAEDCFFNMSNSGESFDWLNPLQTAISNGKNVILYAQNEPLNGILGLFNCLRKEPDGGNVKCVFVQDVSDPPFNPNNKFYRNVLDKGLAVNVYKSGKWGTYRHLKLKAPFCKAVDHSFVSIGTKGDLSSFCWIQAKEQDPNDSTTELVHVRKHLNNKTCGIYLH